MQFKMNKLSWLQIGCNLGWIKKADLNAEDQKMMEDIMQAEPLQTKRPVVKDIGDAFALIEDSVHTLSDISQKILYDTSKAESELLTLINSTISHEMRNPLNSIIN
jgi:signal transduction histidine kinase